MNTQEEKNTWEIEEEATFNDEYSSEKRQELEKLIDGSFFQIDEKQVVKGKIIGISDRDVIINIGFKADGLIPINEFRDIKNLKIGDDFDVYVEEKENSKGEIVLSRKKAKISKAWKEIQEAYDESKILEGTVKRRTKGGLIIDILGIEAFLPGSQIDVKPIRDFDVFVGKMMEVKIVKINYANDNIVVSHKMLIEKDLEQQRSKILDNLEVGQVLEGVIKNMANFGAFIDLGGVDGLLHITDISWGRIGHPEEVLKLDEKINVVVLNFDEEKKRISLGLKQLTSHPWESLPKNVEVGSVIKGRIVNVTDYGVFLEIIPGIEGLIHVLEMSWSQHIRNPQDFVSVNDEIEAKVLTLDKDERKISLSIKQLTPNPWTREDIVVKYAQGMVHKGLVRNLTNFGLFIELEEGIDGLVHVSDLSWTKKIKHPSEFVKVGQELEVKVLELDVENKRLALGHKQLEESPWDTFDSVFAKGTEHDCTILSKTNKGAILELPYGVEGYVDARHLAKEDKSPIEVGEVLKFKVMDFLKEEKKILLSHKAIWENANDDKKDSNQKQRKTSPKTKKPVSTGAALGTEVDELKEIKAQMIETIKKEEEEEKKKQEIEKKDIAKEKEKTKKKDKEEEGEGEGEK